MLGAGNTAVKNTNSSLLSYGLLSKEGREKTADQRNIGMVVTSARKDNKTL